MAAHAVKSIHTRLGKLRAVDHKLSNHIVKCACANKSLIVTTHWAGPASRNAAKQHWLIAMADTILLTHAHDHTLHQCMIKM